MYIILIEGILTDDFDNLTGSLLYAEKCRYTLKELRAQHTEYVRRVVVEGSGTWDRFQTWLIKHHEFRVKDAYLDTKGALVHWRSQ